jgi:MFS family permease
LNHPDRRRSFYVLFAALFVMGASNSMLFVVLPMVTRAMGTGEIYVGLIFAGSALFYMGFSPFWGGVSDHRGRRPILMVGLVGNSLTLVAIALVTGYALKGVLAPMVAMLLFAASRMLYGSIGSAIQPAAQAYIADRTSEKERTRIMSALTAGAGLGTAFGPPLAAWAGALFSVEGFILALAGLSFTVFLLVMLILPEHRAPTPYAPGSRNFWRLAKDHRLWPYLLVGVAGWTAQGVFLQTLLFYLLDRAHLTMDRAILVSGTILAGGAVLVFSAQFVLIPVLRLRPRILMGAGLLITGLGAITMMLSVHVASIGLAFLLTSLGTGLSRPGVVSGASLSVTPDEQGSAAGLAVATAGAGFFLAPFTGLALYQFIRPEAAYAAVAVLVLLAAILAMTNKRIRVVG